MVRNWSCILGCNPWTISSATACGVVLVALVIVEYFSNICFNRYKYSAGGSCFQLLICPIGFLGESTVLSFKFILENNLVGCSKSAGVQGTCTVTRYLPHV